MSALKKKGGAVALFAAAALVLTGCGEEEADFRAYEGNDREAAIQSCIDGGVFTKEECAKGYDLALQDHQDKAPQYAKLEDCEADYGQGACGAPSEVHVHNHNEGGSFFFPFMLGYMMAGGFDNGPAYRSTSYYRSADGGYRTLSGTKFNSVASPVKVRPSAVQAPSKVTTYKAGDSAKATAARSAAAAKAKAASRPKTGGFRSGGSRY